MTDDRLTLCGSCNHPRMSHMEDSQCVVHGCVCLRYSGAEPRKDVSDPLRIPIEKLLFKPNAPAGMNHLVVMSETYFYRAGVLDGVPIIVKREGDYFRIQDGRHRVVSSMLAGRPDVLAVIEED